MYEFINAENESLARRMQLFWLDMNSLAGLAMAIFWHHYLSMQQSYSRPKPGSSAGTTQLLAKSLRIAESQLTGVPHPVTASQPLVAGKPAVPQPSALPLVTSVKPPWPNLYNHGFKNPNVGRPAAISASLTSDKTAVAVGAEAEVPSRLTSVPFQMVTK